MADVLVEQTFESSIAHEQVRELIDCGCLERLRVEWRQSFLSADGSRMVSVFRAPDAESVRTLFRQADLDVDAVWSATVQDMASNRPIN